MVPSKEGSGRLNSIIRKKEYWSLNGICVTANSKFLYSAPFFETESVFSAFRSENPEIQSPGKGKFAKYEYESNS